MKIDIDGIVTKINEKIDCKIDGIVAEFTEHIIAQIDELDVRSLARIEAEGNLWCNVYIGKKCYEFGNINEPYAISDYVFWGKFIDGEYSTPQDATDMYIDPYLIRVAKGLQRAGYSLIEAYKSSSKNTYVVKAGIFFIPSLFYKAQDEVSEEVSDDY